MPSFEALFSDFFFHLANISWPQLLDLGLVTLVFYVLLKLLRRSRATVLLRGTLIVIAAFFVFTVFMPLPTFDYLLQGALIAMLIAIPIIFQPELRRMLEELGRSAGSLSFRRMAGETTLKPLARAIENLSNNHVGALIVLEGEEDLSAILETGVHVGSEVTSELLQTIFYDGTPLHDGAVVIRGDRVVAAGCVLPVSNRQLYAANRRLGTRHRAAVGVSETSDALVLVVSEETGQISVARNGRLETELEKTELRDQIHRFYKDEQKQDQELSLQLLLSGLRKWWQRSTIEADSREIASDITLFTLALLLAFASWAFVLQETNPVLQKRVENIPLRVSDVPSGTRLLDPPRESVSAVVKSSDAILPSLGTGSFQADISLAGLEPGLHRIEVDVESSVRPVRIVSVEPPIVDVQLAEIISRTVPVQVETQSEDVALSPAFEVRDPPAVEPSEVLVSGAAPFVENVAYVAARVTPPAAAGSVQRVRPLVAIGEDGMVIEEVTITPAQAQVTVTVARRENARDVGVRVETQGELPQGYRLSRIVVSPDQVTLLGNAEQIDALGNAIATYPVDLSSASEDLTVEIPLDLPAGMDAVNSQGETIRSVLVRLEVEPRVASRVITRTVQLEEPAGDNLAVQPGTVQVILYGPVPLLNEIEQQPALVQVLIEAAELTDLESDETITVRPTVIAPEQIQAQILPQTVEVSAFS